VRRAIARGGLTSQGWCVAETLHLLEEALRSRCPVKQVLAAESAQQQLPRLPGIKLAVLPDALLQKVSGTETSQGVIALVEPPDWKLEQLFGGRRTGGGARRSAGSRQRRRHPARRRSFRRKRRDVPQGDRQSVQSQNSARLRRLSVPRTLPVWHGPALARTALEDNHVTLFAAVHSRPGIPLRAVADADLTAACALIIGNEARGVSRELRGAAQDVSIPTMAVESLNAAMAAGILLYEARRQRVHRA